MVAALLQDDLADELKEILKDFRLKDPRGNLSGVNVFRQNLPIPESLMQEDIPEELLENGLADDITAEDPYPYIVVNVADGEIKDESSAQTVNTVLQIGVFEDAFEKQGHKDVMNIISDIYERFAKRPVLNGRYTVQYPVLWTLQEEESYPYYFGGIYLSWEVAAVRREDRFA